MCHNKKSLVCLNNSFDFTATTADAARSVHSADGPSHIYDIYFVFIDIEVLLSVVREVTNCVNVTYFEKFSHKYRFSSKMSWK